MGKQFKLTILGGASIEGPDGPVGGRASQRHRLALLAILAASPRGMTRDKLVALLWPERRAERARHALSDSVYRINRALEDEPIVAVGDELRLDPEALPSDLAEFRNAVDAERWEQAGAVYAGPFLDGFHLSGAGEFERWVDGERERLARLYAQALERLAEEREDAGDLTGMAAAWQRRAAHDPYDSRVALRLMEALEAAGNPAAALRHARAHTELLERELGVGPDPTVTAFAGQIRGRLAGASVCPTRPAVPTGSRTWDRAAIEEVAAATPPSVRRHDELDKDRERTVFGPGTSPWRRLGVGVGGILLLTLAGLSLASFPHPEPVEFVAANEQAVGSNPGRDTGSPSIAVLAFEDLSPGSDHAWFADGIAEEIVHALERTEGLTVVARQSSFVFRDRPVDLRRIADTLGAGFVVDGSVRTGGDSVWISAQLIDGGTGFQRWSETFAASMSPESLRSVQEGIARDVAATLSLETWGDVERSAPRLAEESYQTYLEGLFLLRRFQSVGPPNPRDILTSLDYLRQVVEQEPAWDEGWAALGEALHWAAFRDYEPEQNWLASKRALQRAIQLNADHPTANASLGYVIHRLDRDYEGAAARFRHALSLDTRQYWHCGYALFLMWTGRYDDAAAAMRRGVANDPMYWPLAEARSAPARCAGPFEDAITLAESALEVGRGAGAVRDLVLALERTGRGEKALARLDGVEAEVEDPGRRSYLGLLRVLLLARSGRVDEAESLLAAIDVAQAVEWTSKAFTSRQVTATPLVAAALVALGRPDDALDTLRSTMDRDPDTLLYDRCYPDLRSRESDPRYQELLRRTGVPGW